MTGAGEGTLLRTAVTLQRARLARTRRMKRTRPSPSSLQVLQGWHWRPGGGTSVVRLAGPPPSIHVFLPTLKPRKPGLSDGQWYVECPGTEQVMGLLSPCVLYTCVTALLPRVLGQGRQCRQAPGGSWNDRHIYYCLHTITRPEHGSNDVSG